MKIVSVVAVIVGVLFAAGPAQASYAPSYPKPPSYSSYTPSYSTPSYFPRYTLPSYSGYRRPGTYTVRGYFRRNGTYVAPYSRHYPRHYR
jgi:hypothetical protein